MNAFHVGIAPRMFLAPCRRHVFPAWHCYGRKVGPPIKWMLGMPKSRATSMYSAMSATMAMYNLCTFSGTENESHEQNHRITAPTRSSTTTTMAMLMRPRRMPESDIVCFYFVFRRVCYCLLLFVCF